MSPGNPLPCPETAPHFLLPLTQPHLNRSRLSVACLLCYLLSTHASLKCSGARSHNGCSPALPVPTPSFVVSGSEVLSLCSEACILPSPQQPALSPAVCARLQASSLSSVEPLAPSLLSFLLFLIERMTVILGKTDFLCVI